MRRSLAAVVGTLLGVQVTGTHLEVRTTAPDEVARILLTATPANHLGIAALSLEEVFSELVADDPRLGGPGTDGRPGPAGQDRRSPASAAGRPPAGVSHQPEELR